MASGGGTTGDHGRVELASDDILSHYSQPGIVIPGIKAQSRKRIVHGEAASLGKHTPSLFDHDPRVDGALELIDDELSIVSGPILEEGNGSNVGESLGGGQFEAGETSFLMPEEIQSSQGLCTEAHRQGGNRSDSGFQSCLREFGPEHLRLLAFERFDNDGITALICIETGSLFKLQL
jgi:hypothetical protein